MENSLTGVYIKLAIHIFALPPPFLIDIFAPNEISYEVVRANGEKFSVFFWAIFYILSQLGKKYAFSAFFHPLFSHFFPQHVIWPYWSNPNV